MQAQLAARRVRIDAGERPIGWKIGINVEAVQQALGISAPVVGFLSSGRQLAPGETHSLAGGTRVGVEPEVAVHLRSAVSPGAGRETAREAIGALGAAIEIVDIDQPMEDVERILAGNVFHRAVMLGPAGSDASERPLSGVEATVLVNGERRESAPAASMGDPAETVMLVARRLADAGETLDAGQVIIAGSLTPIVGVRPGDSVELDLRRLGRLRADFESEGRSG
jgi:2-keto-4-pentenoate hydratase